MPPHARQGCVYGASSPWGAQKGVPGRSSLQERLRPLVTTALKSWSLFLASLPSQKVLFPGPFPQNFLISEFVTGTSPTIPTKPHTPPTGNTVFSALQKEMVSLVGKPIRLSKKKKKTAFSSKLEADSKGYLSILAKTNKNISLVLTLLSAYQGFAF